MLLCPATPNEPVTDTLSYEAVILIGLFSGTPCHKDWSPPFNAKDAVRAFNAWLAVTALLEINAWLAEVDEEQINENYKSWRKLRNDIKDIENQIKLNQFRKKKPQNLIH